MAELVTSWMLNHRCRANEKKGADNDARLQQQVMIVAHGSWVTAWQIASEPAALCTAGSDYVRERLQGGARFRLQRSGRDRALRGSDVDNSISVIVVALSVPLYG